MSEYFEKSTFLSKLNNEVIHDKNDLYRQRMMSLNSAIFIQWDSDIILYPRETQHFGQLTTIKGKMMRMKDHHMYYKPTKLETKPLPLELDPEIAELIDLFE